MTVSDVVATRPHVGTARDRVDGSTTTRAQRSGAPTRVIDIRMPAHMVHPAASSRAKRAMDVTIAGILLVAFSPVLGAIALAVVATSRGPALFRQERAGWRGRAFPMLKFRTMVDGAEGRVSGLDDVNEADGLLFKIHDDPRVTPVGRVLRRFSLDELPQLWNVVRGDMSLVGPRPLPVHPDEFVGPVRHRLDVRPGITGLWQVSGRCSLCWDESVALDVRYVDTWCLRRDLSIMARTPMAVVRGQGAY